MAVRRGMDGLKGKLLDTSYWLKRLHTKKPQALGKPEPAANNKSEEFSYNVFWFNPLVPRRR